MDQNAARGFAPKRIHALRQKRPHGFVEKWLHDFVEKWVHDFGQKRVQNFVQQWVHGFRTLCGLPCFVLCLVFLLFLSLGPSKMFRHRSKMATPFLAQKRSQTLFKKVSHKKIKKVSHVFAKTASHFFAKKVSRFLQQNGCSTDRAQTTAPGPIYHAPNTGEKKYVIFF